MEVEWGWVVLGFLLLNLSQLLSAIRLQFYLNFHKIPISFPHQTLLYYIGIFYNLAFPGGVGGDGYKAYLFQKKGGVGYKSIALFLLGDRVAGLGGLLLLEGIILPFLLPYTPFFQKVGGASPVGWIVAVGIGVLLGVGGIVGVYLFHKIARLEPVWGKSFLLGVGVQLLQLLSFWALLRGVGIGGEYLPYLALFLLSSILSVLPISIGGVGVRELTLLYGSQLLELGDGVRPVLAGLLFFILTLGTGAIGGILALFKPKFGEATTPKGQNSPKGEGNRDGILKIPPGDSNTGEQ